MSVMTAETAAKARQKLEGIIEAGRASAQSVAQKVAETLITDRVKKTNVLRARVDEDARIVLCLAGSNTLEPYLRSDDFPSPVHPHAYGQLLDSAGVPRSFVKAVENEAGGKTWGKELVARNVNEILSRRGGLNLIRHEGRDEVVKAFLSNKFRRLDSRPLLDAFMGEATKLGLVPVQGVASDTKVRMRALAPAVHEPLPNEPVVFGVEWGNSDYGDGGHVVNLFTTRIVCTNLAITDQMLRQVHLGKRLDDNIEYSRRTYELDTKTNVSALADTVRHALNPQRVGLMLESIKRASADEIKGKDGIGDLLKKALSKTELEQVRALYDGPDVVNLPAGNTKWRLSNALSFFAQAKSVSADRKIELQHLAGALVPHKAHKPLEV